MSTGTLAQMTLAFPVTPVLATRHVVEVNECGIFASGHGKDWWIGSVLLRPTLADRLIWLAIGPGGGLAQLPCEDREEAQFVRDYMVTSGIHPAHVKVKRLRSAS